MARTTNLHCPSWCVPVHSSSLMFKQDMLSIAAVGKGGRCAVKAMATVASGPDVVFVKCKKHFVRQSSCFARVARRKKMQPGFEPARALWQPPQRALDFCRICYVEPSTHSTRWRVCLLLRNPDVETRELLAPSLYLPMPNASKPVSVRPNRRT